MDRFVARENIRRLRSRLEASVPEERPRIERLLAEAEAELTAAERRHREAEIAAARRPDKS